MRRRYRETKADKERQQQERKKLRRLRQQYHRNLRRARQKDFFARIRRLFTGELTPYEADQRKEKLVIREKIRTEKRKKWKAFLSNPLKFILEHSPERVAARNLRRNFRRERRRVTQNTYRHFWQIFGEMLKETGLRRKYTTSVLLSITWYLLAFLLIYIIYQSVTIVIAGNFDIPVIWNYSKLSWPLYTWSPLYTRRALVAIFGAGPLISLLLAFLATGLFFTGGKNRASGHIFWVWCIIHGMNMFFGSYLVGVITRTEFIYTSEWLFLSRMFDVEEVVFSFLSIAAMILAGRLATTLFLVSSGSVTLITPRYRIFYILGNVILPWMVGILIFYLLTTPEHYLPFILKTITPGFLLIPSIVTYNSFRNENLHVSGLIRQQSFRWSIVIAVIAILFFYRIILSYGFRIE